jgi:hypothetical protein
MADSPVTPVAGYKPQSPENLRRVNGNKEEEELLLRRIDLMERDMGVDQRWLKIARTHFEQAYMALNRAIMKPGRIKLPEDNEPKTEGA